MKKLQAVMVSIIGVLGAPTFLATDAPAQDVSEFGTFYSLQRTNYAPLPFNPFPGLQLYSLSESNVWAYDDLEIDYDQLQSESSYSLNTPEPPGAGGDDPGPPAFSPPDYGTNLWLEITRVGPVTNVTTNVLLTLHNTCSNLFYQIDSKLDLDELDWTPGEIFTNTVGLTNITFTPVAVTNHPHMFFRGVGALNQISIARVDDGFEPSTNNSLPGVNGDFRLRREGGPLDTDITVSWRIRGTASNGVDYLDFTDNALPETLSMGGSTTVLVEIKPREDALVEFDETVTLRLVLTNTYVVNPTGYVATVRISDPPEKLFTVVASNLLSPVGIDYYAPSNWLIVSVGGFGIEPLNFLRIDTAGFVTNWSGVSGLANETKIAIVQTNASGYPTNSAGFTNGVMYFGSDTHIGQLLAGGTVSNLAWVTLTNVATTNDTLLRGSLYVDQTGTFSNQLIAVTGGTAGTDGGTVWRIDSIQNTTLLVNITNTHLEGVVTLTNYPARWGPWAGKIITGAESAEPPAIYAIATNGIVMTNFLNIQPEDFDIIPTNQNLYCIDQSGLRIVKLPSTLFTNFVGDLLVTQEGAIDVGKFPYDHPPRLFILHWDGTNVVVRTTISPSQNELFEHVTFAPMDITLIP